MGERKKKKSLLAPELIQEQSGIYHAHGTVFCPVPLALNMQTFSSLQCKSESFL